VFLSTNRGANWTAVSDGMTHPFVSRFALSGSNLIAGLNGYGYAGLYVSTNRGASWTDASAGMASPGIYALAVSGTHIFGTTYGGVWRRALSEMITSAGLAGNETPGAFVLEQNYPNPFNPWTTIRFELPGPMRVTVRVFDLLGREVSVLLDRTTGGGVHEVRWDGSRVASGVYVYRLQAGNYVASKRLVVLK
jgi:hypothetical protein